MQKISELFEAQAASPTETAMLFNGNVGFLIPEYQRPYDWSSTNIRRLLQDCLGGFHRLGTSGKADAFTFLGTLILVEEKSWESSFKGRSVAIVDGQQRLTTLTLLACVIVERLIKLRAGISGLEISAAMRTWLGNEVETLILDLSECVHGAQKVGANKTFPFARIVRTGDQRGRSAADSEYLSALGKFLMGFADFLNNDACNFEPPALGAGSDAKKLGENFGELRSLVEQLSNAEWYENSECEIVPIGWISRAPYRALFYHLLDSFPDDSLQNATLSSLCSTPAADDLVRTILFAAYFARCVVLTHVITKDESAAFDIFDALNTTGEPLTALETLKPRVIQFEKQVKQYVGSPSEQAFDRLHQYIDEIHTATSAKQSETKALVVSFGLLMAGEKLSENLAAQRTFLRTGYDKAAERSEHEARRFVSSLADMAEIRHRYWTAGGIEELAGFHEAAHIDEVQFLVSFLQATKSQLILPILGRYWRPDLKHNGSGTFLEVLRAVTAFLVLRRAATGNTAGIDSDFRAIMTPQTSGSYKYGLCAGVESTNAVLTVSELKAAFRALLARSKAKITAKDGWIGHAAGNPLYQQSRELARFMILVAADRALPTPSGDGCWTKDGVKTSDNQNVYLNFATWRSPLYATVEHIAPDTEKPGEWDNAIYKNAISRHTIGNLCLLPQKENGAIGNGNWTRKRLFYRALTEPTVEAQQQRIQEAAAQGINFSNATLQILEECQKLPLLDPLRDVSDWTSDVIEARGRNITGLVWNRLWPWLND